MAPIFDEYDDEIRGHIALSIKERVDQGADPEAARLAALREFGNVTLARESMQSVWRPRWLELAGAFRHDVVVALRRLRHAKGLAFTVVVTLALGIGANAAIFSVVRQVLLRPLVNRDEGRLVYIRQSAPGLGSINTAFSLPEINDLQARSRTIASFADFSTINFTMVGLGEPRVVRAGVVSGSYFDIMGLRPVLGRLIARSDDGPGAHPVAVLTHRFWTTALGSDPTAIGRTIRLDTRSATVIGVLEPSIPYPADTEIIANVATSPHHLEATMVMERTHRMTELFGRLAPGVTVDEAREDLGAAHRAMRAAHPAAYPPGAEHQLSVARLRDQIVAPARTVLLALIAAAAVIFIIACSNVANLILARSVRRESELIVRAALGASAAALRRTLLAESLVLCVSGAAVAILLAQPLVYLIAGYAARFSVVALDVTVDGSVVWVGAMLSVVAAVVLAFIPRLPTPCRSTEFSVSTGTGTRVAPGVNRRLRMFAITQVALSFVLVAVAGMIVAALVALLRTDTGYNMRQVLAIDVPQPLAGGGATAFFREAVHRIEQLPGVERVAVGSFVPWRDNSNLLPSFPFTIEGASSTTEKPRGRLRNVTPGFFAAMGIPILAGRDFTADDRRGSDLVVVVSKSIATRLFPDGNPIGRRFTWNDAMFGLNAPRRIVGVVADADDEGLVPEAALTVYHPFLQMPYGGRLFITASGDPYALVAPVTEAIHAISSDQPVERAATLADIRAEVLAPERLNAFVLSAFAGAGLLIAVVGVAGVLAFSVSARTREFGVLLAIGSTPRHLLGRVLAEGAGIAAFGVVIGAIGSYAVQRVAGAAIADLQFPFVGVLGAAAILMTAAIVASLLPAARAARVDVVQALRSE